MKDLRFVSFQMKDLRFVIISKWKIWDLFKFPNEKFEICYSFQMKDLRFVSFQMKISDL